MSGTTLYLLNTHPFMHEITFSDVLNYFKIKKVQLILFSLLGILASGVYLLITAPIYEVVTYWNLPQSNKVSAEGVLQKNQVITVPSSFDARRVVLNPATITASMLAGCSLNDNNANRKLLVNAVSMVDADANGKTMLLRVRLEGKETAKQCASSLASEMVAYSNAIKDRYVVHYQEKNIQGLLNENGSVQPTILVSDEPIAPRKKFILLAGILIGLLLSVLVDWVRFLLKQKT
jgi:LPS O-antigen subunit length determinant protein (WzzB/FepE family)